MEAFAKKYAADNSFHYKNWKSDDAKTHQCPVCHSELQKVDKYKGWNCIGFVSAILHHGGGVKSVTCSCSGILNDAWAEYDKLTLEKWREKNGPDWDLVAKQNKKISASKLKKGDVVLCYDGKTFKHVVWYAGDGYIYDSTSGKTQISKRKYSSLGRVPKIAFRYTGEGKY